MAQGEKPTACRPGAVDVTRPRRRVVRVEARPGTSAACDSKERDAREGTKQIDAREEREQGGEERDAREGGERGAEEREAGEERRRGGEERNTREGTEAD